MNITVLPKSYTAIDLSHVRINFAPIVSSNPLDHYAEFPGVRLVRIL